MTLLTKYLGHCHKYGAINLILDLSKQTQIWKTGCMAISLEINCNTSGKNTSTIVQMQHKYDYIC